MVSDDGRRATATHAGTHRMQLVAAIQQAGLCTQSGLVTRLCADQLETDGAQDFRLSLCSPARGRGPH